ncbi:MAG: hypothetical protein ASARMPREDX12_005279 [Alectoria sarmentosa]|nr:MAG: hypothetical protein ASARMPREDX12_005279 [Alectoria sarmentosa]
MATLDVMPSASDYVPAAATSIKRALDLYASELDYDLPPAVKVKTKNLLPECVLPADVEIKSAGNAVIPKIEVSAAQEIAPLQPSYGRRLIPQLIDQRAEESPELPLWSVPISSNLMDGFRDISYGQVARAINRAAWWIDGNIGKSTTFETLAYMGPPDLRYAVLTVAAQKTGHTAFFSSLWNNTEVHLHLLKSANCQVFITPASLSSTVISILAKRAMRVLIIPELDDLLYGPPVEKYPYEKAFEAARHDPFVSCHTSGSTGFPKLITPTHGTLAACDAFQDLPSKGYPPAFVEAMRGKRVLAGVPAFHSAGLFLRLAMPVYYGMTAVEGPLAPLTADVAHEMHTYGNINISILRPAVWEEIADSPDYLDQLSNLDYAMNGACAMPKDLGDKIATKTSVMTFIGSTEAMLLPTEYPDKEDWQYFPFSDCLGAQFRHYHEDLYELVTVRDPVYEEYQSIFFTFPEKQEYSMKDLYSPHPTKPCLWMYRGRADDVVVLMDGKKMHPTALEDIVTSHPEVRSALVFGQARLKPGLLLESKNTASAAEYEGSLLDRIWPTVERANQRYPEPLRITRDHVLFTAPGKPMARTGKGSVQRINTLSEYEREIDAFYEAVVLAEKAGVESLVKDF